MWLALGAASLGALIKLQMKFQACSFWLCIQMFSISLEKSCHNLWPFIVMGWLTQYEEMWLPQAGKEFSWTRDHLLLQRLISMKATQMCQDKCTSHVVGGQVDLLSLVWSVMYSADGYFYRLFVFRGLRGIVFMYICKNYFLLSTALLSTRINSWVNSFGYAEL